MDEPNNPSKPHILPAQKPDENRATNNRADDQPHQGRTVSRGDESVAPSDVNDHFVEDCDVKIDKSGLTEFSCVALGDSRHQFVGEKAGRKISSSVRPPQG